MTDHQKKLTRLGAKLIAHEKAGADLEATIAAAVAAADADGMNRRAIATALGISRTWLYQRFLK